MSIESLCHVIRFLFFFVLRVSSCQPGFLCALCFILSVPSYADIAFVFGFLFVKESVHISKCIAEKRFSVQFYSVYRFRTNSRLYVFAEFTQISLSLPVRRRRTSLSLSVSRAHCFHLFSHTSRCFVSKYVLKVRFRWFFFHHLVVVVYINIVQWFIRSHNGPSLFIISSVFTDHLHRKFVASKNVVGKLQNKKKWNKTNQWEMEWMCDHHTSQVGHGCCFLFLFFSRCCLKWMKFEPN